ncbi:MAG: GWxTD domain-containing protein, partial [bacterium]|nr:GWxTD domain-containing protein [bacterium]
YKDEHIKRVKYANRYYKYGTPLPGWKTDRGKIHILLGPPLSKNEINQNGLYPVQIWDYFGGVKKNLPTVFNIVFYRPHNTVTWKLYIPTVDGPAALLRGEIGGIEPNDYRAVYEQIHDLDPNVAQIALSLIPGENTNGYRPSLQDPMLITKIYDLPKRTINANYARNFLNYKGIVETSVTTSYINIKTDVYTLKDPILGLNFIHLAVKPERVSVDFSPEQNKYYF